jgi:hypothetical protein
MTKRSKLLPLTNAGVRFDANETAFLEKQLEFVESQTYDVLYSRLKAAGFVPVSNEVPEWAETWTYRQWDWRGIAALIANYSDDLPMVDVLVKEFPQPVMEIGDAFQFSIKDLRVSAQLGRPLDAQRAIAARAAIERKIDEIAAVGVPSKNIEGFVNNSNVPITAAPNGSWATATPAQILEDLFAFEDAVIQNSDENFPPDTMLLPSSLYGKVATTRLDAGNDLTILQFFLANAQSVRSVERWEKLNTAGPGSTPRAVCYKRDPMVVKLQLPIPFQQLEPEKRNLAYVVDCLARVGGVCWYYPIGATYGDGI